jgi:hypothetical protein
MSTNIKTFSDNDTTPAAQLGSVGGVDSNEERTSFFNFVRQHLPEQAQSRIVSGKGEGAVVGHKGEVHIFNCDKAVLSGQLSGQFMPEITALVGDMILQFGDLSLGLLPTGAKLLPARQASLGNTQVTQSVTQPARVVNPRSVGQGQKTLQANINTNSRAGVDCWFRVGQFKHQGHVPMTAITLDDRVFDLGVIGNVAVQADLYPPNVLNVELLAIQLAPITIAILDRLEAIAALETRQPALACVERLIGLVYPAKHLLNGAGVEQAGFIRVLVSLISHSGPLVAVGDRLTTALPVHPALIQSIVVNGLHLKQKVVQDVSLLLGGSQPVLVGAEHLSALLLVNVPLNCRGCNRSGSTDKITARPHIRQPALELWELISQHKSSVTFQPVHNLMWSKCGRKRAKKVDVVNLNREVQDLTAKFYRFLSQKRLKMSRDTTRQYLAPVFRYPNKMIVDLVCCVSGSPHIHRTIVLYSFPKCKLTERSSLIPHPR